MISWENLFSDYYIDFNPLNSRGWVEVQCPMCDDASKRGGFHEKGNYSCFRCGSHNTAEVLGKILDYSKSDAWVLIQKYSTDKTGRIEKKKEFATEIDFPVETLLDSFHPVAKSYLLNRGYNPDQIIKDYQIKSTDTFGTYGFRILAPIFRNNRMISFIGRDFTDRSKVKYLACGMEKEVYHYKWGLYQGDKIKNRKALIVEGITGSWKMGVNCVSTYGAKFTKMQVLEIKRLIDKAFILFDPDDAGIMGAEKLERELKLFGVECENLIEDSGQDPGEYTYEEADYIMKQLGLR